jgi:signal transduction histidine kinase
LEIKYLWMALAAAGYGVLAWLAVRRRWQKFTTELLLGYIALSALWVWSRLLFTGDVVRRASLVYGLVGLSVGLGMLTTMFLRQDVKRTRFWLVAGGAIWAVMLVLDLTGLQWRAWSRLSALGLSSSIAIIAWVELSAMSFFLAWRVFRRTWRPLYRNRFRYWMLAIVLLLLGTGLFILLDYPYYMLGVLLHMGGVASAVGALLAHRLPDLSGTVRQLLRHILLTLLTGLVFVLGILAAQRIARRIGGPPGMAIGVLGVAGALALSFPLLRRALGAVLNRLLFGEGYDPQRTVQEYSQGISNILDLEVLVPTAVSIIGGTMGIDRGLLVVCEGCSERGAGRTRLRPVQGLGTLSLEPTEVPADSPLLAFLAQNRTPLSHYDLDLLPRFQQVPEEQRRWFANLGAEVYVPIHAQGQLLGVLALGPKVSGEPYTSADMDLFRTLAGQTAVALENARLVEDLQQLNAEITALNQELTEMNERLTILDRTKSDFISISSHELKTPLTQVKGYADILLEVSRDTSGVQDSVQQMAEAIIRGVKRLHGVVDAMLDVSMIEAQAFAVHPCLTSPRYVVEQAIDSLAPALQERQQTITTVGLADQKHIMADSMRLYQALRNVLINAIKFTPDKGSIQVRARSIEDGEAIEIAITDSGIGIDSRHHELIFEKFYRVDDLSLHSTGSTKFKGAGPGLGLPIAKGIIEAHGGRIWVESSGYDEETLPGSTFYIVLPANGRAEDGASVVV